MWLDRFERVDGKLTLVGIENSGETKFVSPEDMYKIRPGEKFADSITMTTSFRQWERASTRAYTAAMGFESNVTEHHDTYLLSHGDTRILLPAWSLQRDLFGPYYAITRFIYSPTGLESLCSPNLGNDQFSVEIVPLKELYPARTTPSFVEKMAWLYAYPSAYRAWKSVYRCASQGKIGFELPDAEVLMSLHGKYIGNIFYAISVYILELSPLEFPLEWAKLDRGKYIFLNALTEHIISRKIRDERLRPIGNNWDVTDHEWHLIEPIVSHSRNADRPGRPSRYQLREVVNGMIIKMGTGKAWAEFWRLREGFSASPMLYKRLRTDGRWDKIVEILVRNRSQV